MRQVAEQKIGIADKDATPYLLPFLPTLQTKDPF